MSTALDVRAVPRARGVPPYRPRLRRGGDRAARRAVGPRPPLPGRRRAARWARSGSSGSPRRRSTAAPGEDGDFTSLCVAIEEIGRVDQSMGITLEAAVGLGINPILTYGTDEQKQTWLPDLVAGERARRLRPRPSRAPAPTRARPRPRPCSRTASGSSTAPSSSSPTPAPTITSRGHRHRAHRRRARTAGPRSARSSCPAARPASPPRRPTTSSAGTPPTRTR